GPTGALISPPKPAYPLTLEDRCADLAAGRRRSERTTVTQRPRPANRDATRSAGPTGTCVFRAPRPCTAARARADRPGARRVRYRGARGGVLRAARAAPLPQGHGGQDTGPGPARRRRVRRGRGGAVEHRVLRHRAAEARLGPAGVRRGEGTDLRGAARQAA